MKTSSIIPKKLLYIMDPHCAYSYANQGVILELSMVLGENYCFTLLPAGMWNKNHSVRGGKGIREFLRPTIARINKDHNGKISNHYIDLIQDPSYLLSSEIASKAILAMNETFPEKSIAFASQIMNNQFEMGMRYDVEKTYIDALTKLQIDQETFKSKWKDEMMQETMQNAFNTAKLLTTSYPALFLWEDGAYHLLKRGMFTATEIQDQLKSETSKTTNS